MGSYNKRISDQSKIKFDPINRELIDSENSELDARVESLEENITGSKTATGNSITVPDAAPVNAVNLSVDLEPVQDLHGYDNPWVGGAGKNKCPAYTSTETQYGVTIAGNSEGEISVNGTLDGTDLHGFILNSSISLGAGTYTLNGANPNGARLVLYDSNDNTLADTQYANPTFTLESTTTAVLRIFVYANVQYDEVVRPMIRLSTETDPTFAPYTNICPISGRSQVIVTIKDNPSEPTVTKNYTIQLGQTVYGGHLDVTKGKMVVDRGYKKGSDLTWEYSTQYHIGYTYIPGKEIGIANLITSAYKTVSKVYAQMINGEVSGTADNNGVNIKDDSTTDITSFNSAIADVDLVYELATPFTIDLTPQQIKLLENTNTIYTDYEGDTITLEYQPNNAFGELLGEVNNIYDSIIEDIYDKIDSLDTRVTALEE